MVLLILKIVSGIYLLGGIIACIYMFLVSAFLAGNGSLLVMLKASFSKRNIYARVFVKSWLSIKDIRWAFKVKTNENMKSQLDARKIEFKKRTQSSWGKNYF